MSIWIRRSLPVAGALWIIGTALGLNALLNYAHQPGASGYATSQLPMGAAGLAAGDRPTLFVFLHPECPCSRATVAEVARFAAEVPTPPAIKFYFRDSAELGRPAQEASLWEDARLIPGVEVIADRDGVVSKMFGAETSGTCLLYDVAGRLLFHGGVSGARGHEGDNTNKDLLLASLRDAPTSAVKTPIYGCSIF